MSTYKELIIKNIKGILNLSDNHYCDLPDVYTFSQDPTRFPFVTFGEKPEYSVCDNQNRA